MIAHRKFPTIRNIIYHKWKQPLQIHYIAVVNLPEFADLGVRGADIEGNYDMDAWIQHGYEKMIDLENEIQSKGIIAPKRGTAAYGHGMLNQRLDGIKELDDLAKISYHANDQFAKGIMTVF